MNTNSENQTAPQKVLPDEDILELLSNLVCEEELSEIFAGF
uniref:Uncharacterized protein n=1 Tax=Cyanothece sp. (strain PCC 7425 / ATCC 29141) TaxID=395961 RepID=B8HX88_CYAP4